MPPKRAPRLSRAASPASVGGGDNESVISELGELTETLSLSDSASVLETALTKLLDRRAAARLESLETFNVQLALQLHEEFLNNELVALQAGLLSSFKRNIADETVLACRLVELIVITIGSGADRLLDDVVPVLRSLSRHGAGPVRPAAIRALGTVQLMTCHHTDALHHWMASFSRLFRRKDAAVASAAIDAWALLATKLANDDLAGPVNRVYQPRLAALLHSQSVDVRRSAGEALALLFEAVWQRRHASESSVEQSSDEEKDELETSSEDEKDSDDDDDDVQNSLDDSSLESDDEDVDLEELHDLLSQLATDGTRSRARKERSLQRSVFRSVDVTVRSGDAPKLTLKIGKERLTFGTWKSILRLAAMRDVLAQGFYRHVSSNEHVIELLLIPNEKADSLLRQQPHPDSVSVQAKDVSQAKTKVRQQKKKADRNQKHSIRFNTE